VLDTFRDVDFSANDAPSESEANLTEQLRSQALLSSRLESFLVLEGCRVVLPGLVVALAFQQIRHVSLLGLQSILNCRH